MDISIIGCGYVGLVTGVALADIGHEVTCIDIDEKKIEKLRSGTPTIFEPGLHELLSRNVALGNIKFTSNIQEGTSNTRIIFIAVGTPRGEGGVPDLKNMEDFIRALISNLSNDLIIVIKSTVPIGTHKMVKELINKNITVSVKVCVVSNPEFLRQGSAIQDTFHPDRIVVGTDDSYARSVMEELYAPFERPILLTDNWTAELIKYASNAYLATKISFINEVSNICEATGANIEDVSAALGMDRRIGTGSLNAGIGYGGSCLPKDTEAFSIFASTVNEKLHIVDAAMQVNRIQPLRFLQRVKDRLSGNLRNRKITVLGLAFKPNTDDVRNASSITIVGDLLSQGALVTVHDPVAMDNFKKIFSDKAITYSSSMESALTGSDCVIILTEWTEYQKIDAELMQKATKIPIIFDARNCIPTKNIRGSNVEYYSVGRTEITSNCMIAQLQY